MSDAVERLKLLPCSDLAAPKLLPNDDLLGRVDSMNLEHILSDIQINRCNLHSDRSLM